MNQTHIPAATKREVLIEAGYRCAVPTCRTLLILDIHHIIEVSENGGNDLSNLIALCPTCHDLYHRKHISREAISAWKVMLAGLSQAYDKNVIDNLLFLSSEDSAPEEMGFICTGDGITQFTALFASGLASYNYTKAGSTGNMGSPSYINYKIQLTEKGKNLVQAWKNGDREAILQSLGNT